jgi:hypothetical protein
MPDVIVPATSARAKCRACGGAIEKGTLRFGEASPSPFGEGETTHWFHLACAALRRPERAGPALSASGAEIDGRERLAAWVREGTDHPRLTRIARAERASSGRARCRHCHEVIDKDAWRIALETWEDSRFSPIGFVHLGCAAAYCAVENVAGRILDVSSSLAPNETEDLRRALG